MTDPELNVLKWLISGCSRPAPSTDNLITVFVCEIQVGGGIKGRYLPTPRLLHGNNLIGRP